MRKTINTITVVIILIASMITLMITASANTGGFSVSPNLPDNQNPDSFGYFDLRVTPGQQQKMPITVSNNSEEEVTIRLSLFSATTNRNGIVDYTTPGRSDETMKHSLADIASLDRDVVTIPAGESVDVMITLNVPRDGFDGIILGSVHTIKDVTDAEREASGMIINRYSYVIAMRLQQTDVPIGTDFLLGDVQAELVNHRAAIVADIRNPQPRLVMGVQASAQVYPAGSSDPIFTMEAISVDFAPNSIFPFSMVDQAGYGLRAGDYVAKIQLEHEGKTWEFEHEFEILPEEANTINNSAVNQQAPPVQDASEAGGGIELWMLIAAGGGVLLIILVIVLLIKMKSSNKKTNMMLRQLSSMQQVPAKNINL